MKPILRPSLLGLVIALSITVLQISPMQKYLPFSRVPVVSAQALSPGCQFVNTLNGQYNSAEFTRTFYAGEQIVASAALPSTIAVPAILRLFIDLTVVSTSGFPGTVMYTFPQDGTYFVIWRADNGNPTWRVRCGFVGLPSNPARSPALFLADVCEPNDGFSADGWMTLDTDADNLGYLPVLWVGSSIDGPWSETWYNSAPYILNRPALDALSAQAGVGDYHQLWLKVTESGQPVHLGSAIFGREARMDRLCGLK